MQSARDSVKDIAMKTALLTASILTAAALAPAAYAQDAITPEDVAAAQQAWGEGIVAIGAAYSAGEDYRAAAAAAAHIERFYAYGEHPVLFKPTLAAEDQFRGDFDEALSYFVGGSIEQDGGFAIAPYTHVRWENEATFIDTDSAMAMGNYFFTTTEGEEVRVEYSFGYVRDDAGELKIVLHHSSLPFSDS